MVTGVNPAVQLHKVDSAQHDDSSSEFFHIAEQFLANTPVPKTRETYGRELGFFVSWYGKDGSIADINGGHLQIGGLKIIRSLIEGRSQHTAQQVDNAMHRIVSQMRIGRMALFPDDCQNTGG